MTATARVTEFALNDCLLPDPLRMMRLSILDWAACGLAGVSEPVSVLTRDMVEREGGGAQASVFGGGKGPGRAAALVNGVTSHALDYDDTHFAHIGHPSVAVVSAAFAVAEQVNASGEAFVQACLAGAEASVRIGSWLGRDHYQIGFHQTGTAGCFGAAIAAVRLLGCDAVEMSHAIGLASTRAAGLKSQFGTMGKPYNAGAAAAAGVEVALLAKSGFVSTPTGLEGPQGFAETHSGAGHSDALQGLGQAWVFEQISHKYHACCHGTHAMIDALKMLEFDDVSAVTVYTHPRWLSVCNQPEPATGLEAKFSYRFIAAMVIAGHDTASIRTFSDHLVTDPMLCALRDKVQVISDPNLSETACRVTVTSNGDVLRAESDIAAPLSLDTRAERLHKKAISLIGAEKAAGLRDAVLEDVDIDVPRLAALLRQGQ